MDISTDWDKTFLPINATIERILFSSAIAAPIGVPESGEIMTLKEGPWWGVIQTPGGMFLVEESNFWSQVAGTVNQSSSPLGRAMWLNAAHAESGKTARRKSGRQRCVRFFMRPSLFYRARSRAIMRPSRHHA